MNYSNVDTRLKAAAFSRSFLERLKRIREASQKARTLAQKKTLASDARG